MTIAPAASFIGEKAWHDACSARGMRTPYVRPSLVRLPVVCLALVWLASFASAASAETITATAQIKTAGGVTATAPVTISIDRFATDAERDALLAAIKTSGREARRGQLLTQK